MCMHNVGDMRKTELFYEIQTAQPCYAVHCYIPNAFLSSSVLSVFSQATPRSSLPI